MPLARKRVLVVDDEMLIALETERKLLNAGCTVIGPAARLAPAIAMAREEAPDAAVLDINLAGADGLASGRGIVEPRDPVRPGLRIWFSVGGASGVQVPRLSKLKKQYVTGAAAPT